MARAQNRPKERRWKPPSWASASGKDEFGRWAEFQIPFRAGKPVTQRLRWIPWGKFQMGSPENEEGRIPNEGPQHTVTISRGYWLFDIPCTQELWLAGENPSRFKGDRHPVEQVSFDGVTQFLAKVNDQVPGLSLSLPSEAQWEYACRAGTTEARYGPLDEVAWYRENSDSQTHNVGEKLPNPWGLYDMLGNVWEWCSDRYDVKAYARGDCVDPVGPNAGSNRVIRGDCWSDYAQDVRAARRFAFSPVIRYDGVGFRCLSSGRP